MFYATGHDDPRKSESLLGLLGYYEAILERDGLVTRISEIRSLKLGMTLDLLKMVDIAEDLKAKLISAIVRAWEIGGCECTKESCNDDISMMQQSIASVRRSAQSAPSGCNPAKLMQLDAAVMLALPLMPGDLRDADVPLIRDLLNQVLEGFSGRMAQESLPCL